MRRQGSWDGRATAMAAVLLVAAACGGRDNIDDGTGAGPGSGGAGGVMAASSSSDSGVTVGGGGDIGEVQTHSVTIGPFDVAPGQEETLCVVLDAGNPEAGWLRRIRTVLTEGSHHMIVSKVSGSTEQTTPSPCAPFAHGGDTLFIAEKQVMELTYPDGAGLPFSAHQLIGLEMHFINAGSTGNLDISGTVELDVTTDDTPLDEVKLLFVGNMGINIPPQGSQTVTGQHFVEPGAEIFALTSHMHRLGVHATIERTSGGVATELLHESFDWAEPPFDVYQPAVTLASDEQLRLTCEYNNPTNQNVGFGLGYYDEMCFLWAHYITE